MTKKYLKALIFVIVSPIFLLSNTLIFAQTLPNVLGDPHYGSVEFGNNTSSISKEVSAGGAFDLSEMNSIYGGYISSKPDLQLSYTAENSGLKFKVESHNDGDDPVILIFSPTGEFLFNDDIEENGYDSEISIENPQTGNYAIWIGNFDSEGYIPTTLVISKYISSGLTETPFVISSATFDELNVYSDPYYGEVTLESGFMPDPFITTLAAGGSVDLSQYGHSGFSASNPDVDFYYTPSGSPNQTLTISVRSEVDTILLINGPEETWYFSDDANDRNPAIIFNNPKVGLYSIFVGTYNSETAEAELLISEL